MFEVKSRVMYGRIGACEVMDITGGDMFGKPDERYYILHPLFSDVISIITPVDKQKVTMRSLMSKQEILSLIDSLQGQTPAWETDDKLRNANFTAAMNSGLCGEWITVIELIRKNSEERLLMGKPLSQNDKSMMKDAKKLLYEEFSLSLNLRLEEVETYIVNRMSQSQKMVS